jgi:hypothetical protein
MTRMSKQSRKRAVSPRKPRPPSMKTGPKRDQLEFGHKVHSNAIAGDLASHRFIPKIGGRA